MAPRVSISPTEGVLFKYFKGQVRGVISGPPVTGIRPVHPLAADQPSRAASTPLWLGQVLLALLIHSKRSSLRLRLTLNQAGCCQDGVVWYCKTSDFSSWLLNKLQRFPTSMLHHAACWGVGEISTSHQSSAQQLYPGLLRDSSQPSYS